MEAVFFVDGRQPKSFCEWNMTSICLVKGRRLQICLEMEENLKKIYEWKTILHFLVNGRQPQFLVKRMQPQFFWLMKDNFNFVCKWKTISICL